MLSIARNMDILNRAASIQLTASTAVHSNLHRPVQINGMLFQNVPSALVITPPTIKTKKKMISCRKILIIRKMYRLIQ